MRNVLHMVSSDYPPRDGGIARLCQEIVLAERRREILVHVIAPLPDGQENSTSLDRTDLPVPVQRGYMECGIFRRLRKLVGKGATVCAVWYPDGLIAALVGTRPLVLLAHGSELMPPFAPWRAPFWNWLRRRILSRADLVIANSRYTRELVMKDGDNIRAVDIPLGVDHRRFVPMARDELRTQWGVEGKFVLLSVSRVCAYKGHDVVLDAMAALPPEMRAQVVYLVAGKGPHLDALKKISSEKGLTEYVRWLGFVQEQDLPSLYNVADLFVLCTRETVDQREVEGFGLVFLEAQACGTPVIGTNTGGIPDAVAVGCGGWLIEQDDHRALAQRILDLMKDATLCATARMQARKRIENDCTWVHYMRRFRAVLKVEGIYGS